MVITWKYPLSDELFDIIQDFVDSFSWLSTDSRLFVDGVDRAARRSVSRGVVIVVRIQHAGVDTGRHPYSTSSISRSSVSTPELNRSRCIDFFSASDSGTDASRIESISSSRDPSASSMSRHSSSCCVTVCLISSRISA